MSNEKIIERLKAKGYSQAKTLISDLDIQISEIIDSMLTEAYDAGYEEGIEEGRKEEL